MSLTERCTMLRRNFFKSMIAGICLALGFKPPTEQIYPCKITFLPNQTMFEFMGRRLRYPANPQTSTNSYNLMCGWRHHSYITCVMTQSSFNDMLENLGHVKVI